MSQDAANLAVAGAVLSTPEAAHARLPEDRELVLVKDFKKSMLCDSRLLDVGFRKPVNGDAVPGVLDFGGFYSGSRAGYKGFCLVPLTAQSDMDAGVCDLRTHR